MKKTILYRDGYKYQLAETYTQLTPIQPRDRIATDFIALDPDGTLIVATGYAWDGPSGPTFDTPCFMRGSLVHDALYQLMRDGHLSIDEHRQAADDLLRDMCKEDGMSSLRAWWVHLAVRSFGKQAADQAAREQPIRAPADDMPELDDGGTPAG